MNAVHLAGPEYSKIDPALEGIVRQRAMEYLKRGKPNWDVPHTHAAVFYMGRLIDGEGGNERVLKTAMYLHDIGYSCLSWENGYTHKQLMAKKPGHMKIGAIEAGKILKDLGSFFFPSEREEIVHLVRNHDNLDRLESHNEILVMEADSLAQIDTEKVRVTFSMEDYVKLLEESFLEERVPRFRTGTGKMFLGILLSGVRDYLEENQVPLPPLLAGFR